MSQAPYYLFLLAILAIDIAILASCTTRYDPMPKWKGYALEFNERKL